MESSLAPNKQQLLALVVVLLLAGLAGGSPHSLAATRQKGVIHIVSDRLEADQQEQRVVFLGHVVATQGDLTIKGDRLTIFYLKAKASEPAAEDLSERIERIVVEGNVLITQRNSLATGDRAVYERAANKVVLTGAASIRRGEDVIQGTSVTLFLDSQKTVVEGSQSAPVEATIFSSGQRGSLD